MIRHRGHLTAALVATTAILCSCSSSAPHSSKQSSSGDGVQTYLNSVNTLCDALLTRVIAVTHGGSLDIPVADYLAQQPAHAKLLSNFDEQLARVPVPAAAKAKATAFADYVHFANQLDAKRLAAAKRGEAAYAAEISAEKSAAEDPALAGLSAAGFSDSCQAR